MYRKNDLKRKVLITPDEVIFHSDLQDVVYKNLLSAVIVAEERFIKKLVCADLYNDFRDKKNVIVDFANLSDLTDKINEGNSGQPIVLVEGDMVNGIDLLDDDDPYIDLWNEFLWKICAECVVFVSLPNRFVQSKPTGEMVNQPLSMTGGQDAASADLKTVQWKSTKLLMDRIEPLMEAMKEWLCENRLRFPKFTCHTCPEREEEKRRIGKQTPWVRNIYDDCKRNRRVLNATPGSPVEFDDDDDD